MRFTAPFCFTVTNSLSLVALAQQSATHFTLTVRGTICFSASLSVSKAAATNFLVEVSHDDRSREGSLSVDKTKPAVEVVDHDPNDSSPMRFFRARVPGISFEEQQAAWAAAGLRRYK